jgi:hypothetical protein
MLTPDELIGNATYTFSPQEVSSKQYRTVQNSAEAVQKRKNSKQAQKVHKQAVLKRYIGKQYSKGWSASSSSFWVYWAIASAVPCSRHRTVLGSRS